MLFAAKEDVAGGVALDAGEEGAVLGEAGDGDAVVGAVAHEEGGDEDVAEGDDAAAEEVDGEELFAGFGAELDTLAFFGEVGALGEDVEGVEAGEHGGWGGGLVGVAAGPYSGQRRDPIVVEGQPL